jgi:hypothetical protein
MERGWHKQLNQRGEDVSKKNWCYDVLLDLVDLLCPLNSGKESYLWFSTECVIHWPGLTLLEYKDFAGIN